MHIQAFQERLLQILGIDARVGYPGEFARLETLPTDANLDALIQAIQRSRGVGDNQAGEIRAAWRSLSAPSDIVVPPLWRPAADTQCRPESVAPPELDILNLISKGNSLGTLKAVTDELPMGVMVTRHDDTLKTDMHFVVSRSTKIENGQLAVVPDDAKAIMIWLHGSGVNTAFGGNIWQEMNALQAYGVATVAMDLPYHRNGPTDRPYLNEELAAWINRLVEDIHGRYPGKKIIVAGHSAGPEIGLDYISRIPTAPVDAMVLFSPTGRYSEEMNQHHDTTIMRYLEERYAVVVGEKIHYNAQGDLWYDQLADGFDYMNRPPARIPMLAVVGTGDQWFPNMEAPKALTKHFPMMRLATVPGMDHFVFNHKVGEMSEAARRSIFNEDPPSGKDVRFVVWTVIDFLRANFPDLVPNTPIAGTKDLPTTVKASLLYEMNPLFRQSVGDRASIATDAGTRAAIDRWNATRLNILDRIFETIVTEQPEFYRVHKKEIDALRNAKPVMEGSAGATAKVSSNARRKAESELRQKRSVLLSKLQRYLAEEERRKTAQTQSGFGIAATTETGSRGTNQWTRLRHEKLKRAYNAYRSGRDASIGMGSRLRRLAGVKKPESLPSSKFETIEQRAASARERLSAQRDAISLHAKTVLAIGGGSDVTTPFGLFEDTERVIIINPRAFGSPQDIEHSFNPRAMEEAHWQFVFGENAGTNSAEVDGTIGGELIDRILVGLKARMVSGIYYFGIDANGNKVYINPGEGLNPDFFANAEVRFEDRDGKTKVLEFVSGNIERPTKQVMSFLSGNDINAVFAAEGATVLETSPSGLGALYKVIRGRDVPWLTTDRRQTYLRGPMHTRRPLAFLNTDRVETIEVAGRRLYVSHNDGILRVWKHSQTASGDQAYLDALAIFSKGEGYGLGGTSFEPPPDRGDYVLVENDGEPSNESISTPAPKRSIEAVIEETRDALDTFEREFGREDDLRVKLQEIRVRRQQKTLTDADSTLELDRIKSELMNRVRMQSRSLFAVRSLMGGITMPIGVGVAQEVERLFSGSEKKHDWREELHAIMYAHPAGIAAGFATQGIGKVGMAAVSRSTKKVAIHGVTRGIGKTFGPGANIFLMMLFSDYLSDFRMDAGLDETLRGAGMMMGVTGFTHTPMYLTRSLRNLRSGTRGSQFVSNVFLESAERVRKYRRGIDAIRNGVKVFRATRNLGKGAAALFTDGLGGLIVIALEDAVFASVDMSLIKLMEYRQLRDVRSDFMNRLRQAMANFVAFRESRNSSLAELSLQARHMIELAATWKYWEEDVLPFTRIDGEFEDSEKELLERKKGLEALIDRLDGVSDLSISRLSRPALGNASLLISPQTALSRYGSDAMARAQGEQAFYRGRLSELEKKGQDLLREYNSERGQIQAEMMSRKPTTRGDTTRVKTVVETTAIDPAIFHLPSPEGEVTLNRPATSKEIASSINLSGDYRNLAEELKSFFMAQAYEVEAELTTDG